MATAVAADAGAVTLNYGMFLDNVISFLIGAFAVFLLVRGINSLKRQEEAAAPPAGDELLEGLCPRGTSDFECIRSPPELSANYCV